MRLNKGDVILIVVLMVTVAFFAADFWLIVRGHEQWSTGAWTCFAAIFGGELLSFSLYRIGKGRSTYKAVGKHSVIDKLEEDIKQAEKEAKENGNAQAKTKQ